MTKAGVPWKREIVANFENGRRDRLDVDELLALAVVFQVPPIMLLLDAGSETTAVTPKLETPTASALLWMLGEQPLHGPASTWAEEIAPIQLVRRLHDAGRRCRIARRSLEEIEDFAEIGALSKEDADDRRRVHERDLIRGLRQLSQVIFEMRSRGIAVPVLVGQEQLEAEAEARGFTLGQPTTPEDRVTITEES